MSSGPEVEVLPNVDRLAASAARRFVAAGQTAIDTHGRFIVALAGGSTPRSMYARLASEHASSLDWSRVHFLWGDERCVPPDHDASNYRVARETLLAHIPVPDGNVHRIRGEDAPAEAAGAYERVLRKLLRTPSGSPRTDPSFRLDLVLLGLGTDGHTASLFPGGACREADTEWVAAEFVRATPMWRVTLTPIVINAAAEIVFLVSGHAKAGIVRTVLEGPNRPDELPAQLIAPTAGRIAWLLDSSAAAGLQRAGH